ncbi:hypothetical protein ACFWCB_27135 [Streptomyces sp. NPDC060048]|uniref:hypothetical protein n=1 Tax=unclassified Streptomyces TaxID=2593676 RepID=UPI0036874FC0
MTDIAIIGLGCRLPGAPDIRGYWKAPDGRIRHAVTVLERELRRPDQAPAPAAAA